MGERSMLLHRDLFLIEMNLRNRILCALIIHFVLSGLYVITGHVGLLNRGIIGSEASLIRETWEAIPVYWILLQFSAAVISHDFVRKDLFSYSSNIIVRLRNRASFWDSKILTGMLLCMVLALMYCGITLIAITVFAQWTGQESMSIKVYLLSIPYGFVGMFSVYCIYHLGAMVLHEAVGIIGAMLFLLSGMVSDSPWLVTNHIMLIRTRAVDVLGVTSYGENSWYLGIVLLCIAGVGRVLINRIDIFGGKGE